MNMENVVQLKVKEEIYKSISQMEIIDSHEHLPSEANRIGSYVDALSLFTHYCRGDLESAGLPEEYSSLMQPLDDKNWRPSVELDERWDKLKPFYKLIEHTNYYKAAAISMGNIYGEFELNEESIFKVTELMQKENKPGLYQKVLKDKCNIITCLNQNIVDNDSLLSNIYRVPNWPTCKKYIDDWGSNINTFDDFIQKINEKVQYGKENAALGIKFLSFPFSSDLKNYKDAKRIFDDLKANKIATLENANALTNFTAGILLESIAENDLVACVHTGYWDDYRKLHPSNLINLIEQHRDVNFDVFHLGYPYVRETIILGKTQPNVWLNMCWTYLISSKFAKESLEEMLEMIPINKILGFGGDYSFVENIFGHLSLARDVISDVLAKKVYEKNITIDKANEIATKLFRENPQKLYKINI